MRLTSDVTDNINKDSSGINGDEVTQSPDDLVNKNIDKLFGTPKSNFEQSAFIAKDVDPQQATESYKLSKKYNVPAHFVQENLDSFKEDKPEPLNYEKVSRESQVLAKYLENPTFAAMSKDDLDVLSKVTNHAESLAKSNDRSYPEQFIGSLETGTQNLSAASYHLRAAMGMGNIEDFAQEIADINKDVQDKKNKAPTWVKEFNKDIEKSGDNLERSFGQFKKSYNDFADGQILEGLANAGEGGFKTWGNLIAYVTEFASHPRAASSMIAESAAFSFPSIALGFAGAKAGAIGGGAIAGPVGLGIGATAGFVGGSFTGSTATEVGAWINSALSERGYDITDKDDIISAYKDKTLMSEIRAEAVRKGVTTGAVDALFNTFGGKFLKSAGKGFKSKVIAGTKDLAVQSTGEGLGEFSGQAAAYQDVNKASLSESVLEGLSSFGQSIADTAIGVGINKTKGKESESVGNTSELRSEFSSNPVSAAKEISLKAGEAQKTLQELSTLEKLGQLAQESKLNDRSQEAFSELIDQVTPAGETQKVLFQKNEWDQFWTEQGESPVQKAEELLSVDSYNEADEKGTDIEIPTKEFVSRYAGDGNYDQLLRFVRTRPDGLNLDQAQQLSKELPALMNQIVAEAKQEKNRLEKQEIEFKEIKVNLEKQLVEAGGKKAEALLITEFYKSVADETGLSPADVAKKYPLTINQQQIRRDESDIVFEQDELKIHRDDAVDLAHMAIDGDLKQIGKGAENSVFDAGDFVAKTLVKKDYVAGKGNNKRFLIESVLEDNGISPKQIKVETKSGEVVLLQKKEKTLEQHIRENVASQSSSTIDKFLDDTGVRSKIKFLEDKIEALGFSPVDLGYNNLSIDSDGNVKVIDAGVFSLKEKRSPNYINDLIEGREFILKSLEKNTAIVLKGIEKDSQQYKDVKERSKKKKQDLLDEINDLKNIKPIQGLTKAERDSAKSKIIKESKRSGKQFFQDKKEIKGLNSSENKIVDIIDKADNKKHSDNVRKALELVREAKADSSKAILYNSATSERSDDISNDGIIPMHGSWIQEVANNNELDLNDVTELNYFDTKPEWFYFQIVRKLGLEYGDLSRADIVKNAQLSIVIADKDDADFKVTNDDLESFSDLDGNEIDGFDSSTIGPEPGDVVTEFTIRPDITLTGEDVIQFVKAEYGFVLDEINETRGEKNKIFFQDKKETQAERKARAEELGFDTSNVLLHGTPDKKFTEFKPSTDLRSGPGVYFFSDKENHHAHNYTGEDGRVIDVYVKRGKYFEKNNNSQDNFIKVMNELGYNPQPWIDRNKKKKAESIERAKISVERAQQRRADKGLKPFTKEQIESMVNQSTTFDEFDVVDFERAIKLANGDNKKINLYSLLKDAGYLGVIDTLNGDPVQTVFDPKNIRSVDAKFDPVNIDSANIFAQDKRGQITVGNGNFNIDLFATADKSTFIHEAGHYFLEVVNRLAALDTASEQFKTDHKAILNWFGVESSDQIKTEHHEQFARAWELYAREGKSPSKALRKLFNTFKIWLTNIYKNAEELDVEINDELRSVFDRLLTSKQESKKAIDSIISSDISSVMPESLKKKYMDASEEFKVEAEEELLSYLNSFDTKVQRAKNKILKNRIRKEETEKVNELEVYNNISLLTKGKFANGTEIPADSVNPKIDLDDAKSRYPEIIGLPNFKGAFSKDQGLPIEDISGVLGYESVDAMIEDFKSVPVKSQAISLLTEKRFQDLTEDALNDPDLTSKAEELAHNDQLTKMIRLEYEFIATNNKGLAKEITRQVIKRPAPQSQIKKLAEIQIDNILIKDIKPHIFKLAFNRHRKESGEHLTKGDIRAAFDSKEKELLNLELYKFALKAKEYQKKKEKDIKKFFKPDKELAKTRELNFINTARAILSRYGLGRSNKEPLQYLATMKDYNPEAYENMSAIITQVINDPDDYNNIEYSRFKELIDTVQTLWELSKDVKAVEVKGKKVSIESAVDELTEQSDIFRSDKVAVDEYQRSATEWDKLKSKLLSTKSYFVRKENWIDMMDMGNIQGPFRKYIYQSISDANVEFLIQNKKYKQKFLDLSRPMKDTFVKDKEVKAPEIGFAFRDKGELLGSLLHIGNSSNKKKLLVGRDWGSLNEDGSLNDTKWKKFLDRAMSDGTITKADMDYIQGLWDLMDEIKPMAQRAYKKVFGYYFLEITSEPIETPFGKYRGGYAPAMVDPHVVKDIARKSELENFIKGHNSFTYPAAGGSGFGKSRVENYNKPLNIDINMVSSHIETVLKFSTIKPAAVDVLKITMNENFKNQINQIDDSAITEIINPAINRADKNSRSNPSSGVPGFLIEGMKNMQSLASMQFMFLNIKNIAEQVAGFATAATRIKPKYLLSAGANFLKNHKEVSALVRESSPFIKVRDDEQMFEINKESKDVFSDKSFNGKTREWSKKNAYIGQIVTQNLIEKIVWTAAYDEGVANGLTHDIAVDKADADVRITQGSRRPQDIASVEANAFLGFFNMFYNFFNTMANLNAGNFKKLYYQDLGLKQKFSRGMYLYMMGYASISIISEALSKMASGGLDEDEDGEYADDIYDIFIQSQIDLGLAMIPGAGGALNAGLKWGNDIAYDDRVSASPALSVISTVTGVASKFTSGKLTDNKGNKRDVKDVLTALGVITGTPIGALGKPAGYLIDVDEGKAKPSGPIDAARGIITGRPGVK